MMSEKIKALLDEAYHKGPDYVDVQGYLEEAWHCAIYAERGSDGYQAFLSYLKEAA